MVMTLKLAFGVLTLARGTSALFKVESDGAGVEADMASEVIDEDKGCVWAKTTNSSTTIACLDGSSCDVVVDGWSCCSAKQSFRAMCPRGYMACNEKTPLAHDFICGTMMEDCADHGGPMTCEKIHPCAWSASDKTACQELVFGYGQYMVMKIGEDGCTPGWMPIQKEETCRDAQFSAGLSFGYVESDPYSVCNFCAGCETPLVHLDTNHLDKAKWICRRDPASQEAAKMRLSKGQFGAPCTDADPANGMGPRDQYGHGCGAYKKAKDWCGNFDDPDFQALEQCCACQGLEADRRRRGSADGGDGAGPLAYPDDTTGDGSARRRGNVRTGTLVLDSKEKGDLVDSADVETP